MLFKIATTLNLNPRYRVGQAIDNLHGGGVYYNGGVAHSAGRNLAPDGYNLGLRYQLQPLALNFFDDLDERVHRERLDKIHVAPGLQDFLNVAGLLGGA